MAVFFIGAFASDAHAYRKPKNPRRARAASGAEKQVPKEASSPNPGGFLGGRWDPSVRAALDDLIVEHGKRAASYDEARPPVAVVAWDAVGLSGDAAEAVFYELVTKAEFRFSDEFWKAVPVAYGRQRIRAAHEQFSALPASIWSSQPAYRQFRKFFFQSYQQMCEKVGRKECRVYLAQLLQGFSVDEARDYAKAALAREASVESGLELVGEDEHDPLPARWRRGLAVVPELKRLVETLRAEGFDVWALGLEAQPVLEASAAFGGVDATRCLGIRQETERDILGARAKEPVPVRGGQVEAVVSSVGRPPALALGAGPDDADLLSYGRGLRVLVNGGDDDLAQRLRKKGVVVQRPFL